MAFIISTSVHIQAPPTQVWAILVDFPQYAAWNPFIPEIEGTPEVGAQLKARIVPQGQDGMTFKPRVKVCQPNRELRWLGKLLFGGIFDGEHRFELQEQSDGSTLLIHSERFSGVLVPFMKKRLNNHTKKGFEAMNVALKARAERR
jgi:hypothetical protein